MTKDKSEFVKEMIERISSDVSEKKNLNGITNLYYVNGGKVKLEEYGSCHSGMGKAFMQDSPVIGQAANYQEYKTKYGQHCMKWLVGKDSLFWPLIKYLGKDFHVIHDDKGNICGWVVSNTNVNIKLLHTFFKSIRIFTEHRETSLKFWKKWAYEGGYNPRVVWILASYFNIDGGPTNIGHGHCESSVIGGNVNLKGLLDPNKYDWVKDINKNLFPNGGSYSGEQKFFYGGGKFNPKEHIRPVGFLEGVDTIFYKKYYHKTPKKLKDEDLHKFFKDVDAGLYNEYM